MTGDDLSGRVALVTGTSRNIGGGLASGLSAAGALVACNDLRADVAEERTSLIAAAGGRALAVPFDVTDPVAASDGLERVISEWGRVDILVNNAVLFSRGSLLDMPVDRFRRQVDVLLGGAFIMSQLVARSMIDHGVQGTIVNVLSTAAWQGEAGNIGYSTAKSGLVNFTRAAAMDLAPYGIRVNSLTPTATQPDDPELARAAEELFATAAASGGLDFNRFNPWRRLPTPTDYVGPLVFLVSDDAGMMTGTNLTVDGGALAKYWPQIPERR
ncbi:MAG TPA: SDR family oxidoreductase [Acidimicrobiales bacterium]|nr:SDR family oxidoreductase [Acidimicrobiales bacterium]